MSISDTLLTLAPTDLPILRLLRYDGGGFGVPLAAFDPADQTLVHRIYRAVKGVHDLWQSMRAAPDYPRLTAAVQQLDDRALVADIHTLGRTTAARDGDTALLRKICHDVRGGGLTGLVGLGGLLKMGLAPPDVLDTCVMLARDHAKIMRNAVVDLDPPTRAADEEDRAHGIEHFLAKWDGATLRVDDRRVQVGVDYTFHGSISARCLETSAIDRIVYNYVNNASRFAADGRVTLSIFPVGAGKSVRWVVANALTMDQRAWLGSELGDDFRRLFLGGLTRGGQGIGLSNCADFVAMSFGLPTAQAALDGQYLGAAVVGGQFYAWFHWPIYEPVG